MLQQVIQYNFVRKISLAKCVKVLYRDKTAALRIIFLKFQFYFTYSILSIYYVCSCTIFHRDTIRTECIQLYRVIHLACGLVALPISRWQRGVATLVSSSVAYEHPGGGTGGAAVIKYSSKTILIKKKLKPKKILDHTKVVEPLRLKIFVISIFSKNIRKSALTSMHFFSSQVATTDSINGTRPLSGRFNAWCRSQAPTTGTVRTASGARSISWRPSAMACHVQLQSPYF